jgi:hypothetical protein
MNRRIGILGLSLWSGLVGLASLTSAGVASAQGAPRSFAVYSEVAREISVVTFQEATGSRLDTNLVTRIPIPKAALDQTVQVLARQEVGKTDPGGKSWLIAPLDSDLFDARGAYVEGSTVTLPADLKAAMKERGLSHLLLFTRYRSDAALKAVNGMVGTGQLEGLGFYIDRQSPIKVKDSRMEGVGFLAPYLYVRVTLIDGATGRVLRSRRVVEGHVIANARPQGTAADPWEVMTPVEKVQRLSDMIMVEIGKVLPEVLAP